MTARRGQAFDERRHAPQPDLAAPSRRAVRARLERRAAARPLKLESLRRLSWLALYVAAAGTGSLVLSERFGVSLFGSMPGPVALVGPALQTISILLFALVWAGMIPVAWAGTVASFFAVLVGAAISTRVNAQP